MTDIAAATTYHPYPTEAGLFADRGVASYRVATTRTERYTDVRVQALDAAGNVLASGSHSAFMFEALRNLPLVAK
jgi:hypothetical protein